MFLEKDVLKICSKFSGEHACRSVISIKLKSNLLNFLKTHPFSNPKISKSTIYLQLYYKGKEKLLLFVHNNPDSSAVAESIVILQVSLVI